VDEIGAVAVLAEPVRHRLYDAVASASGPIGREEAAQVAAVPLHSARFHLDKLVDAGLLEVSYARISGRSGPGAGRPAKLYRRSAVEVTVSLPKRSYDLVGGVLASALERTLAGDEVAESLRDEAHTRGRTIGAAYDGSGDDLHRASGVLAEEGFEPQREGDEVCLRNCPFDALVAQHAALVCGVNLDFVTGVLEGLGCASAHARLQPDAEHCCVRLSAG
jgi:predicted ArsR family transcriptional regulator